MAHYFDPHAGGSFTGSLGWSPDTAHKFMNPNQVTSPLWVVKIDDLVESDVADFTDHTELFDFKIGSALHTAGHVGNERYSNAAMQHANVWIKIYNGYFAPKLENKMFQGANIEAISIVKLAHTGEQRKINQKHDFSTCRLITFNQDPEYLYLTFSFVKKDSSHTRYKQDGSEDGSAASSTDFSTNTNEEGA